ncbi:MAG TPA: hypothetical protein VIP46_00410 [Pyrinomonadaceae bacterium]
MRLSRLVSLVLARLKDEAGSDHLNERYIYGSLNFSGGRNMHVANPPNEERKPPYKRRDVSLTGEEEVGGDYLLFVDAPHDMWTFLEDYDTRGELEARILGGGGLTNPFVGCMIAIVDGEPKDYELTYFDESAGARKRFAKSEQDADPNPFGRKYPELELRWLG